MAQELHIRIQIDPNTNVLKFYLGNQIEHVGTWELDRHSALSAEDLERQLGYAVLSLLSVCCEKSIGNRRYLDLRENRARLALSNLKSRLDSGDKSAVIDMMLEYVAAARRSGDLSLIFEAEKVLSDQVSAGNFIAEEYLSKQWPREKRSVIDSMGS